MQVKTTTEEMTNRVQTLERTQPNFANWFDDWLTEENYAPPRRGEVLAGEVLAADGGALLVDIGAKRDAIVPADDLRRVDDAVLNDLSVGDQVPVCVMQPVNGEGNLIVSLSRGLEQKDWIDARARLDDKAIVESQVLGYNKGGLLAAFGALQAFMPNSLVSALGRGLAPDALERAKAAMVGQSVHMQIIEVNRANRRLVASQRAADRARRADVLAALEPGQVHLGRVVSLTTFGAFVDLGGVDGLLHISELAWSRVEHPSEVLEVGQGVEVLVMDVNRERERIRLSRKRLPPTAAAADAAPG